MTMVRDPATLKPTVSPPPVFRPLRSAPGPSAQTRTGAL
jgi:hypothetical protein